MKWLIALLGAVLCLTASARAADVDDLIKQLGDSDPDMRRAAARGLAAVSPEEGKKAVPALLKGLRDGDVFVRRFSAQALSKTGSNNLQVLAALEERIRDKNERPEVFEAVVGALGQQGKGAVNSLATVVKDAGKDSLIRRKAAEALGKIGTDAREAVPALTEALSPKGRNPRRMDMSDDIRLELVTALGQIANAKDAAAITALEEVANAMNNRNRALRQAAGQALSKVKERK